MESSEKLSDIRKKYNLNIFDIAEILGVSVGSISNYITGRSTPKPKRIAEYEKKLMEYEKNQPEQIIVAEQSCTMPFATYERLCLCERAVEAIFATAHELNGKIEFNAGEILKIFFPEKYKNLKKEMKFSDF